jgi:hypothetical protein
MALRPTQPPIQWVRGALSLGVKQPRREADHSPPFPQYASMAWCSVKAQGQFYLYLLPVNVLCTFLPPLRPKLLHCVYMSIIKTHGQNSMYMTYWSIKQMISQVCAMHTCPLTLSW